MSKQATIDEAHGFVLDAFRVTSLASLRAVVESLTAWEATVVVDLSLGAWRGQQAADECRAQLGLAPDDMRKPQRGPLSASTFVDAETAGDSRVGSAIEAAHQIASAMRAQMRQVLVVLAPRYGIAWERADALLLEFLSELIGDSGGRLLLAVPEADEYALPPGWTLAWQQQAASGVVERTGTGEPAAAIGSMPVALVPGVLDPGVLGLFEAAAAFDAGVLTALAGGCAPLVAPEWRRPPGAMSQAAFASLVELARPVDWLEAYSQCFAARELVDIGFLSEQADQRLARGERDVALRLLDRAAACARWPEVRALLVSRAQGMRIALMRFEELAAAPDPPPAAVPPLRGFLNEAKGWGLVMTGRAAEAVGYLAEARRLLPQDESSPEYLYLLNISALSLFRAGDVPGALAMERRIEAAAPRLPQRNRQLEYVNALNLARLFRHLGEFDTARTYFERGFATVDGVRTEGDALYANVCFARLDGDAGACTESFMGWLRASLHWLSSVTPEALPTRAIAGVLGLPWPLAHTPRLSEVAAALAGALRTAATTPELAAVTAALRQVERAPRAEPPLFARTGRLPAVPSAPPASCLVGVPGVGVLVGEGRKDLPQRRFGPEHRELRALVYAALTALAPGGALGGARVLLVDDASGYDLPVTFGEALHTCMLWAVPRLEFGGRSYLLNTERRGQLEAGSCVRLTPAVERIDSDAGVVRVYFKRYLPPLSLTPEQVHVVQAAANAPTVAQLLGATQDELERARVLAAIRELERLRVIDTVLTEAACTAAGLSLELA